VNGVVEEIEQRDCAKAVEGRRPCVEPGTVLVALTENGDVDRYAPSEED